MPNDTEVDKQAWDKIYKRIQDNLSHEQQKKLLNQLAILANDIAITEMRNRSHKHGTGETEKFLVREINSDTKEVYAISPVVGYLEYGTKDHGPSNKEFLYFENTDGQLIRKRQVKGIPAQHNVQKLVIPKVTPALLSRINEVIDLVVAA
jgi:hypothetical protein